MTYSELVQLYFDRSSALQWYWTIYVVIIGGLLAFSSMRERQGFVWTVLITILYSCFAYKNLGAIEDVRLERQAIVKAIKQKPLQSEPKIWEVRELLEPVLDPSPPEGSRDFHIACDLLTIAAVWTMEFRRRKIQSEKSTKSQARTETT